MGINGEGSVGLPLIFDGMWDHSRRPAGRFIAFALIMQMDNQHFDYFDGATHATDRNLDPVKQIRRPFSGQRSIEPCPIDEHSPPCALSKIESNVEHKRVGPSIERKYASHK